MNGRGRGNPRNFRGLANRPNWRQPQERGFARSELPSSNGEPPRFPGNFRDRASSDDRHFNAHFQAITYRPRTSSSSSEQSHRGRHNAQRNQREGHNSRFNTSNSHERFDRRERRPIGFKALESLLEKDPEELIMELANTKRGLLELLQTKMTEDTIVLFIKILKKTVDATFEETKYKVLQMYLNESFVEQLVNYILRLPMQNTQHKASNRYFWTNQDEFWYNLIGICQHIYDSIPTFSVRVVPEILKSLTICFPSFELQHHCHISDQIKEDTKNLNEAVQTLVKQYEEKVKLDAVKKLRPESEMEPPDDFRQISVYPNSVELVDDSKPFLRKNVVKGPYRDVNHYLDVQFRLLRQDFVGPLRSGIMSYRSENQKNRLENVRVHPKVQFLNPETVNEQYCIRLRFDFSNSSKKKKFKYENSKRFMFGSLLCFTSDNFRSIIFGKIAERKVEDLEKGQLIVGFDSTTPIQYKVDYLMVECGVYFEPYYHVLNVLQHMRVEDFPMEKYIIYTDPSVQPPEYLMSPNCRYTIRGHEFSPLINWPSRNFYQLNDSQIAAFKAALTQEFSIIQGPPGTGKTFLGLKIAKTLLENNQIWYKKTPMLVICYTNHALDQFLEGLTHFTQEILRIGGQSKNEKLKEFNLRSQSKFRRNAALSQQRSEVKLTLIKVNNTRENLNQIELYNSIRSFEVFDKVVPNYQQTWFGRATKEGVLDWLLGVPEERERESADPYVIQISAAFNSLRIGNVAKEDDEESDDESEELNEEQDVQIDDLFDEVKVMATQCSTPLITLPSLQAKIKELENILSNLSQIEDLTLEDRLYEEKLSFELFELQNRHHYIFNKLTEAKQLATTPRAPPIVVDLNNPHKMPPQDRWNLYFYWLDLYKQRLHRKLILLDDLFRKEYKLYEEMRDIENTNSMKNVLVVGMTTTGAARLRSSLQALKSPIVIVEEAAEVLEAHIVSSLTKHCKHLILIGDHQQLKPSTANYQIETFYNLGISLFERMVINQIQLFTLNVQHRMRPEISSLISPSIYPNLKDHDSVHDRPPVKGLDNCLFFIDHTNPEEAEREGTTKKNRHEVEFLINFAMHLILNGHEPEEITILAAYLGQMFEMQKEKKKHEHVMKNVRIAVLDNYQGEESDIILLSLVRNNKEGKIGFLSIENRVCVALSRARNGFFLMGNMDQLCSQSKLWEKIRTIFDQQNAIGTKLALRCQMHRDKITYVKSGEDFLEIPEGGCNQKCGAALICGHKCTKFCHIQDREHINYTCREICHKNLCKDDLHLCKKMCYEECGPCSYLVQRSLECGHVVFLQCHVDADVHKCVELVSTKLPCGHVADKPCHRDPQTYRCPHPCETQVENCGHACLLTCHVRVDPDHLQYKCTKKCARYSKGCTVQEVSHLCRKFCYEDCDPCRIPVKKKRTNCPHWYDVACSSNVDLEVQVCKKPCTKTLPCGHKCKSECYEPCGPCQIKVDKTLPECGHKVKVKCCETPNRKLCNKKCPLKLVCGHDCTKRCNEPCTSSCKEIIDCEMLGACGHRITRINCYVAHSNSSQKPEILMKYCNKKCTTRLKCGHNCSGTCGECHQGRIHKSCSEKCGFPLICNHPCEFPCRQACRPCARKCEYKCKHSSCGKRCGDLCTPCKEPCTRRCKHQKCTRFCNEICDIPPCEAPCEKTLKCKHPCVGFCGDPCPPLCRICQNEELTTIFFGTEDDEDARFVFLNDCGHVLESEGLNQWMDQNDGEVAYKVCPKCKTPIKTTQRYSDTIKMALIDVVKVKTKFHGGMEEINRARSDAILKVVVLKQKMANSPIYRAFSSPKLLQVFQVLESRLQIKKNDKRQPINKSELNAIESKLQIIEYIMQICIKVTRDEASHTVAQVEFILEVLMRDENHITEQEIDDIQFELNRLVRMVEFSKIKNSIRFDVCSRIESVKKLVTEIEELLFGVGKFVDAAEGRVTVLLKRLSEFLGSGLGISDKERREIVAAIGLKQGHWYKCPNGHVYAIGECGGAMQEAKCPEPGCRATIGGSHHTLASGNAVAPEMDGARYAAWSDTANMANYRL